MRSNLFYLGMLLAVTLSGTRSTFACDFCLMHQGISPLETLNGAGIRITQRYTLLDSVFQGTNEVSNPGASEEFWTTDITGFYSINEGFLLMANIPLRVTRGDGDVSTAADGSVDLETDTGGDEGLGDISLLARYTFYRHHTLDSTLFLAVSGGVKLPTGATDARTNDGNEFLDAHTQLGTGSTDALLGASFNYAQGRFAVSGNVLGAINGEGEFGDTEHRFGNSINYDLTGRYRLFPTTLGQSPTQVFVSLGLAGEVRAREYEDGAEVSDSGGHTVYIAPGLQVNFAEHWVAELAYQHAVYHNLNGTQLGEDFKVFGNLTYLF
jgi:hypothetical protein